MTDTIEASPTTERMTEAVAKLEEDRENLAAIQQWVADNWLTLDAFGGRLDVVSHGVYVHVNPDELAEATRLLSARAPLGSISKDPSGGTMIVTRKFGPRFEISLLTSRAGVCEKVVTGTDRDVKTALSCVHCGSPIRLFGDEWEHVNFDDLDLGYQDCGITVVGADEGYGPQATPPSFTEVEIEEVETFEWRCDPLLVSHPVDCDEREA